MANLRKFLVAVVIAAGLAVPASTAQAASFTPITQAQTYADGSSATMTLDQTTTTASTTSYPCGYFGYSGIVKYRDIYGVVVWTYKMNFVVHVCNNQVNGIYKLNGEPVDSCCGWGWVGVVAKSHSPIPYGYVIGNVKGEFQLCVPWLCDSMYPWFQMTIGGNGNLWADKWGIG